MSEKNETCRKCGALFAPEIHFVRCEVDDCPMKSKTETRSLLEMLLGEPGETE